MEPVTISPDQVQAVVEQAKAILAALLALPGAQLILGLIGANTALAIAAAAKNGQLQAPELWAFLIRDILPKVITYGVMQFAGESIGFAWAGPAALALIVTNLSARIVGQLAELGLPLPEQAKRLLGK
jgi:hypothetical protein